MEGPLYLTEESKKKKNGIVPKKSYPGCQRLSCAVSGFGQVKLLVTSEKKISGAQGK